MTAQNCMYVVFPGGRKPTPAQLQSLAHFSGFFIDGDRLPWAPPAVGAGAANDNFTPLESLDWQVHVYGPVPAAITQLCRQHDLALHNFAWHSAAAQAGLQQDAIYLVRPDGYIGLATANTNTSELESYLRAWCGR